MGSVLIIPSLLTTLDNALRIPFYPRPFRLGNAEGYCRRTRVCPSVWPYHRVLMTYLISTEVTSRVPSHLSEISDK